MNLDIGTPEGRRGAAFLALVGGAMVNTVFAVAFIVLLRHSAGLLFWLALCAELNTFTCLTGLSALLVKRSYAGKIAGGEISISDGGEV